MQRPARFLFATYLATMVAVAGSAVTTAADTETPTQVLLQVSVADTVMAAHWTREPDAYVLQVMLDEPRNPARKESATIHVAPGTPEETRQPGIVNIADVLTQLVPPGSAKPALETMTSRCGAPDLDHGTFFICNTIINLRGMDPSFGCSTLSLVDGRRVVAGGQRPAPTTDVPPLMHQPYPPRNKASRVDVWLLKADGTQTLPATYSCHTAPLDPAKPRRHLEISYEFPIAGSEQAVAAAIRIDDNFYIEKLRP